MESTLYGLQRGMKMRTMDSGIMGHTKNTQQTSQLKIICLILCILNSSSNGDCKKIMVLLSNCDAGVSGGPGSSERL